MTSYGATTFWHLTRKHMCLTYNPLPFKMFSFFTILNVSIPFLNIRLFVFIIYTSAIGSQFLLVFIIVAVTFNG